MFPVHLQTEEGQEIPKDDLAYLVGRDGIYAVKKTFIFRAVVQVPTCASLAEVKESGEYLLSKIPAELVMKMLLFFRAIWKRARTEAVVLISYHPGRKTFRLDAPEQKATSTKCEYQMPLAPADGFMFVGTAHSHGDFSAFHSGTDQHDEMYFDGIHITFGHVDKDYVDIVASLAVGGKRFPQSAETVLGGLEPVYEVKKFIFKPLAPAADRKNGESGRKTARRRRKKDIPGFVRDYGTVANESSPAAPREDRVEEVLQERIEKHFLGFKVSVPEDVPESEYTPPLDWSAKVEVPEPPAYTNYGGSSVSGTCSGYAGGWYSSSGDYYKSELSAAERVLRHFETYADDYLLELCDSLPEEERKPLRYLFGCALEEAEETGLDVEEKRVRARVLREILRAFQNDLAKAWSVNLSAPAHVGSGYGSGSGDSAGSGYVSGSSSGSDSGYKAPSPFEILLWRFDEYSDTALKQLVDESLSQAELDALAEVMSPYADAVISRGENLGSLFVWGKLLRSCLRATRDKLAERLGVRARSPYPSYNERDMAARRKLLFEYPSMSDEEIWTACQDISWPEREWLMTQIRDYLPADRRGVQIYDLAYSEKGKALRAFLDSRIEEVGLKWDIALQRVASDSRGVEPNLGESASGAEQPESDSGQPEPDSGLDNSGGVVVEGKDAADADDTEREEPCESQ